MGLTVNKYKQTEIGLIPNDWTVVTVGKLTEFHKQGYYTTENYKGNGKYYLLRGTDMQNPRIDLSTTPKVDACERDYESYKVLSGDFLFVRSGAIGRYGIVPEKLPNSIFGSYLINFRFTNKVDNKYFGYFYQSELSINQLKGITQGGGNLNINAENIKALKIPLPPTNSEQAAIATALSDTDDLIENLEKLIFKKRSIKQGAMQELLKPREKWELKTYGEVFNFLTTATYSRAELKVNEEVGYIHYGDIHTKLNFFLDADTFDFPTISSKQAKNYHHMRDGDIIIVDASEDYAGVGKSVEVKNIKNKKIISGLHTFLLRDEKKILVDGFRGYLHASCFIKKQFDTLATGLKVFGVSRGNLKKVLIPIPSKKEQQIITNTLIDMDMEIEALEKKLYKYRMIKQGMMHVLLAGKIRLV